MPGPDTPALVEADREFGNAPAFAPPTATPPEILWRHAGWHARRTKIRQVLGVASASATRCDRWDNCGACAVVEYSKVRQRHRVTCWHCRDRFCVPCQTAKRCELVRIVNLEPPRVRLRMLTFTLRHDESRLRPKIAELRDAFRKLQKSAWWRARVVGGVSVLEIKLSTARRWHPHIHAIVDSEFLPVDQLSEQWRKASGGSFVVHVREVKEPTHAAGYVAKYLTKGIEADVLNDSAALAEAITALRGARSFDVFGSWRGARTAAAKAAAADDPDESCGRDHLLNDWTTIASLRDWLRSLRAGDAWAAAIQVSMQNAKYKKGDSS